MNGQYYTCVEDQRSSEMRQLLAIGAQGHRGTGAQGHRGTGAQGHRVTGSQGHRVTGS
jgi:hypothetical protein